jgi:hypothetical protein
VENEKPERLRILIPYSCFARPQVGTTWGYFLSGQRRTLRFRCDAVLEWRPESVLLGMGNSAVVKGRVVLAARPFQIVRGVAVFAVADGFSNGGNAAFQAEPTHAGILIEAGLSIV